jgi:hypothetical protein
VDVILASGNIVGVDSIAALIMGFDPQTIEHLRLCAKHGLGSIADGFDVVGDKNIEEITAPFRPAHHNAVSRFELVLRKSYIRRLVFNTPLFSLMTWCARRYYDAWDLYVGKGLRRAFFETSPYAEQWHVPKR